MQKESGSPMMKNLLMLSFAVALCSAGCAKEVQYVKMPRHTPHKKLIVLPDSRDIPSLRPYVVNGTKYYPLPNSDGFVQFGKASWYGKKFHGRTTSSGEKYNMYEISAAHKTLPLGTYVRVTRLSNKKAVTLRINDRGPFVKGRIIDLSYAAGKKIGLIGPGVCDVKVVALGKEIGELTSSGGRKPIIETDDFRRGDFTVQVGAFKVRENATQLADRLKVIFNYVDVKPFKDMEAGTLYRVRVSKARTLVDAEKTVTKLGEMGLKGVFIVGI